MLQALDPKQHFTKPPARFTEAALVKELEKRGIGRPSTYAAIISPFRSVVTLRLRTVVSMLKKWARLSPSVWWRVSELLSYDFTAQMEDSLDTIAWRSTM